MSPSLASRAAIVCAGAVAAGSIGMPDSKALELAVSKIFVAHVTPAAPAEQKASIFSASTLGDALDRLERQSATTIADAPSPAAESPRTGGRGSGALAPLYASFVALQALDVHSTMRAVDRGARESNPIMAPFAERPAAFVAMKAATTVGVLYMTERVRRHSPWRAIVMMAAFNSVYATVVANNYRLGNHLGP